MYVVQQLQRLCLQVMNDVLLAQQERMTMQTAVDGATLLQQQVTCYTTAKQIILKRVTAAAPPQ